MILFYHTANYVDNAKVSTFVEINIFCISEPREHHANVALIMEENIFGNLYEEGVVDPAKVTRSGIQNATSIASMILTTECIIVDEEKSLNE